MLTDRPGCSTHYEQLQYTGFATFGAKVAYALHGTTHIAIGGVYGVDWYEALEGLEYDMAIAPS